MAKGLQFELDGSSFEAAPVKLDRKKIYGWSSLLATDSSGRACVTAYLCPDDNLVITSGGLRQGTVDDRGQWIEKSSLIACDENGEKLPVYPSSFDEPVALRETVSIEEFLDNAWDSVYEIRNDALAAAVGAKIFRFPFSYRAGTNRATGYLLRGKDALFLFAGSPESFPLLSLQEETVLDEGPAESEEIDELDFSMF